MKMTLASMLLAGLTIVPSMVRSEDCCSTVPQALAAPATQPTNWVAYGEPMKLTDEANVDAAKVLADVKAYDGKTVRLTGEVVTVCKKKGCWLKLSSNGSPLNIFVEFTCPIEGRLIPVEAVGKPVIVEGKLTVATIDEDEARHIAEDDGQTKEQIEAIKGDQQQIRIEGPSALVGA